MLLFFFWVNSGNNTREHIFFFLVVRDERTSHLKAQHYPEEVNKNGFTKAIEKRPIAAESHHTRKNWDDVIPFLQHITHATLIFSWLFGNVELFCDAAHEDM